MDPVGPWSTYASYNRLQASAGTAGGELHHLPAAAAAPPTTTAAAAQLIPGGFLSPPSVAYETVFTPLFHHAGAKTHYRPKQIDGEYHQAQFFEAPGGGWQQNSPFGILPHESVVSGGKSGGYENFNPAHFAVQNHLKVASSRSQSPKTTQANTFFPAVTTGQQQQQSCIVSSSTAVTKEYRLPVAQARTTFLSTTPNQNRQPNKQQQIQTKAQTKVYPDQNDRQRTPTTDDNQSFPNNKQFPQQNYRHYQTESDFQRAKTTDYANDCSNNVAVPRRPSPLQAHSQPSPLGHAPSPAYPMYNSPQQPTPSPLDVTVPRPNSQAGNVAYSSVITRYERPLQQNSWPERSASATQNQRKFNGGGGGNFNTLEIATNRKENVPQVQQGGYFEGAGVTLQDLSSCRGDPMGIVKNLQQTCHVQQQQQSGGGEVKQEVKGSVKRRKSNEKAGAVAAPTVVATENAATTGASTVEYFSGRIPPPAHSSATNHHHHPPQQQNGTYFDFDRWNLPPPASKIFTTQAVHQQHHQGLMVPHHPPPPLPYFTPFHLPPHPPEFELTPVAAAYGGGGGEQTPVIAPAQGPQYSGVAAVAPQGVSSTAAAPPVEENQPKVVVPNIEEELNFLSEGTVSTPNSSTTITKPPLQTAVAPITKPTDKPTGPGAGFMSSYLKFLQGERDSSPPPITRGARKQTWTRTPKPETKPPTTSEQNGIVVATPPPPPPPPITRLSQGDPQDDPRYFPLPKERKRSLDSSDEGLSSDDDLFNRKVQPVVSKEEKKGRRGRQAKGGERKRGKKEGREKKASDEKKNNSENDVPLPRRETSKRAAKEKINMKQLIAKQGDDELEEPPEFADSDSDPAWTPQAKNDGEEEPLDKRRKRGRPAGSKKKLAKNFLIASEIDSSSNDSRKQKSTGKQKQPPPTLENNTAAAVSVQQDGAVVAAVAAAPDPNPTSEEQMPFKPGEFVVIKSELNQEFPAIWRVDGKTLLQKYEPFEQNGQTLYRNISTYTSWTPDSKRQYVSIPVRCKAQSQMETIVEFLREEMTIIDQEFYDRIMRESQVYQDNFEVYIQTLISQALDSNFLTEIFQEKDEYFLSNVKTIDDVTTSKRQKLLSLVHWPASMITAISTWPCFNVIGELNAHDAIHRQCAACLQIGVGVRVLLYGQPYNATTLEGCQPTAHVGNEKDFFMCRTCVNRVELLNKITHQKYLMYVECAKRVTEKRTAESHKDTTCILNELLADENWLNQLFLEVRSFWAEVDSLEHGFALKRSRQQTIKVQ